MTNPLVWLDMEMTGLDVEACVPIEVAIIITDDALKPLESWESQIWQPESALEKMSPFVRKMHSDNGLLAKVRDAPHDTRFVEQKMVELLMRHCAPKAGVLSGNSVHHDKRFLARYFPTFHNLLHYRIIDVSSIKEVVTRWYPERKFPKPTSDHTALADVQSSIAELAYYRANVFQ